MALSPVRPKGPPLNALRAFEAAARLGGFAAAAEELSVTPGAVAQHIKALEEWTGEELFERRSQGVRLTVLGAKVLPAFTRGFDQLGGAVQALRTQAEPAQIRIAALPSIAQLWLSPRLPAIRTSLPAVFISVTALEHRPNLLREPFDVSIFFDDQPGDTSAIEVCNDVLFPVCSPEIAAQLQSPADLAKFQFLHDSKLQGDWQV